MDLSQYLCDQGHEVSIIIDANRIAFNVDPRIKLYLLKKGKLSALSNQSQVSAIDTYKAKKKKKAKKKTALKRAIRKIQNIKEILSKAADFSVELLFSQKFCSEEQY
ncbi:hypothetical protein P4S64_23115 [Vibrio sp. M60_M31a]